MDYASEVGNYRKICISCLQELARIHAIVPTSCYLSSEVVTKVGDHPVGGSANCDIWTGRLELERQPVCLKVLRYFPGEGRRELLFKAYLKEVIVWRQLRHPRILPLLGVNEDIFSPCPCLISPWMRHGNIIDYIKENSKAAYKRLDFIIEIADAIQWLHSLQPPVVHADIKGANILISDDRHCYLADFGLAFVVGSHNPRSSSSLQQGTIHWLAPEYLDASSHADAYITARDIYAFGCTIVEIYTGKPPFSYLKHYSAIIHEVLVKRNLPPRPGRDIFPSDELWSLVLQCLSYNSVERPEAIFLFRTLQGMLQH
ncbi:kinase-like protein [Armillaria gallica]|uniref:Kinase-like protein n=1 Tax=Armillaria gallica TaxID=47427 RepID=A0A2H3D7B5_ARMGA|nr:kinase-like protein [Armillaria gallica]